jgi:hypothetical protein
VEQLDDAVPPKASIAQAKAFWWATILVAAGRATNSRPRLKDMVGLASHLDLREEKIADLEQKFQSDRRVLLVVYDAIDTISNQWPRRRL